MRGGPVGAWGRVVVRGLEDSRLGEPRGLELFVGGDYRRPHQETLRSPWSGRRADTSPSAVSVTR